MSKLFLGFTPKRRAVPSTPSQPLKPESRKCLRNLSAYSPPPHVRRSVPASKTAAVLVALFVGRQGDLYVLLSRRSATLKTYPGDTSLPGGRWEKGDKSLEDTARREAWEEVSIGLPRDRSRIPLLCTLEPFMSGNNLLVTPVVVLITDPSIQPILNLPEVVALFSHPLHAFLFAKAPFPIPHLPHPSVLSNPSSTASSGSSEALSQYMTSQASDRDDMLTSLTPSETVPSPTGWQGEDGGYHTWKDLDFGEGKVRFHRFLTGREDEGVKPVYGLTASILLYTAITGYQTQPSFEPYAQSQKSLSERIDYALKTVPALRDAVANEERLRSQGRHGWVSVRPSRL